MVGNEENILVEFDYDNIIMIDPNKVIDENGKAKERYVKQENLVMYANLECKLIPRTKLALGASYNDQIQTISLATINFMKPGGKTFLDNSYTDEITGKDTLKGEGVNQITQTKVPTKSQDYYIRQTLTSNGEKGKSIDTGLLGITRINIRTTTAFDSTIEIDLEDIKGRALFESGDNSPYAAFFNFPYPLFYLTIKGYYGKALRLPIQLMDFKCAYDTSTGNFRINTKFNTYKFGVIGEVNMSYLKAVPHMYKSLIQIQQTNGGGGSTTNNQNEIVEIGYQKVREMYNEYKSKGLIPKTFPELTIVQLKNTLSSFLKNLQNQLVKVELDKLNTIEKLEQLINKFQNDLIYKSDSWVNKYLDINNYFILEEGKVRVYTYKKEILTSGKQSFQKIFTANTDLDALFKDFKKQYLLIIGSYTDLELSYKSINYTYLESNPKKIEIGDVNILETYKQLKGSTNLTEQIRKEIDEQILKQLKYPTLIFDANFKPIDDEFPFFYVLNVIKTKIDTLLKELKTEREQLEKELTDKINNILQSTNDGGLGFKPTIRNVLSIIFANGEAFLRLLDDVHTKAWNINTTKGESLKIRKESIFNTQVSEGNPDNLSSGVDENQPIYPWPTFLVNKSDNTNGEKYIIEYPGNYDYLNSTKGFVPDIWPEVEFVEEYIRGYTERTTPPNGTISYGNELTEINRITFNAIEFPNNNEIFSNLQEIKFFYEIYERIILYIFYTNIYKISDKDFYINLIAKSEYENIINGVGNNNPLLVEKIREYGINGSNIIPVLRHISNDGVGQSWQNFIRGIFNTSYIANLTDNSQFQFYTKDDIDKLSVLTPLPNEDRFNQLITSQTKTEFDVTDTYPFIDKNWCLKNLANGSSVNDYYDTYKTLVVNPKVKMISNFGENGENNIKKPISNFNYLTSTIYNEQIKFYSLSSIKQFYNDRKNNYENQLPTEGNLRYFNYSGDVSPDQTTSILNTPYFINSIVDGVKKFQLSDEHPYVSSAYLFINSLPLSTLKEKYKSYVDNSVTELDYIFATLKKFGAIHKLPYAWILKIGSVYHRYKTFIETGVDIIDTSWSGFSYVNSFDPVTSVENKTYYLTINGSNIDITLQQNTPVGTEISTLINTGFYPKLINDFNLFYQGYYPINPYLSISGTGYISDTTLVVTNISSNNLQPGNILFGAGVIANTSIVSQIGGTPGGIGSYVISQNQNVSNLNFEAINTNIYGYTDQDIQTAISSGLTLNYVDSAIINLSEGFDLNQPNRDLRIIPWSVYMNTLDGNYSYIMPSTGFLTNQTLYECFSAATTTPPGYNLTKEVTGNTAMFNGSVRLFWQAPHYGYFDTTKVTKPSPYEYMKLVFSGENQENYSINGLNAKYSKIDEIFSVFEKDILDKFENIFLNFSKSEYNYDTGVLIENLSPSQTSLMNFQMLFKSMMKINKVTGYTGEEVVTNIIDEHTQLIKSTITTFLNYDIYFKYGNPSNFNRKLFGTFSSNNFVDPYTWEPYSVFTPNALPPQVPLAVSKLNYPNQWKTLETYVGFSELSGFPYSNNGSFITDFFIDNNVSFTSQNIKNLSPIIKMYATQKYLGRAVDRFSFTQIIDNYLDGYEKIQSDVITSLFIKLQNGLTKVNSVPQFEFQSVMNGGDLNKVNIYETFKALNDKWIAGMDIKSKTLFEDVLIFDRASRNIGDKFLVDLDKLRKTLENSNESSSMYDLVASILGDNQFNVMNIPAYVNFYGIQDVSKNAIPKPEGTLESANSLFGNFMNVDYNNSTTKLVCFYGGPPSQHLDVKDVDYKFRNDSFDIRRSGVLSDNLIGKNDYALSNKVVGFNVDIGVQNQQVVKNFVIDQRSSTPTIEGIQGIIQMADQSNNNYSSTQSVSMYNIYKTRMYTCSVTMMGNAMIQPMMYFNLRYVPMFHGPYLITEVTHAINQGGFETQVTAVRQAVYKIDEDINYLQSIKVNLLQSLKTRSYKDDETSLASQNTTNLIYQKNIAVYGLTNEDVQELSPTQNQKCKPSKVYSTYSVSTPNSTKINQQDVAKIIKSATTNTTLGYVIFAKLYLSSRKENEFMSYENNYASISLGSNWDGSDANWGDVGKKYFTQEHYFCSETNLPYAYFNSAEDSVKFLVERWLNLMGQIKNIDKKQITKFLYLNQTSTTAEENIYSQASPSDISNIENSVEKSIKIWNVIGK